MSNALRAIALTAAVLVIIASCRQEVTAPDVRFDHEIEMRAAPPCIEVICVLDSVGNIVKCDTVECP